MDGAEILRRATSLWPMWKVPYDMESMRDGYRTDCSGFVSMVLGIPASGDGRWGGESTITLPRWLDPIDVNDLQPGDIVGCLGPGTGGAAGHVVIFERWLNSDPNDDRYYCLEQSGDGDGPRRSLRTYPYDGLSGYRAWRFKGKKEGAPTMGKADEVLADLINPGNSLTDVYLRLLKGDDPRWTAFSGKQLKDAEPDARVANLTFIGKTVEQLAARPPAVPAVLDPAAEARIVGELVDKLLPAVRSAVAATVADELARRLGNG